MRDKHVNEIFVEYVKNKRRGQPALTGTFTYFNGSTKCFPFYYDCDFTVPVIQQFPA